MKKYRGFTLLELLIVIAIIAILAAIIYVAIDPVRRLAQARNAERSSEVNGLLSAVLKYAIDTKGALPPALAAATVNTNYMLGTAGTGCDAGCTAVSTQSVCLDLTPDLVDGYISSIPLDIKTGSAAKTMYYISKSAQGRITIGACTPEKDGMITPAISVTR